MSQEQLDRFIAQEPLFAQTKAFRRMMAIIEAEQAPPASVPLVPERKANWIQRARRRLQGGRE